MTTIEERPCHFCGKPKPVNEWCECPQAQMMMRASPERSLLKRPPALDTTYQPPTWMGESLVLKPTLAAQASSIAAKAASIRAKATSHEIPLTDTLSEAIVLLTRACDMLATTVANLSRRERTESGDDG